MYTLTKLGGKTLPLGRKNEKGVAALSFDLTAWLTAHPAGTALIQAVRPTETDTADYTAIGTAVAAGTLVWTVDAYDTAYAGRGFAEVRLADTNYLKVYPFHTYVSN